MNEKALTNAELELTQKIQRHFPRNLIHPDRIKEWNELHSEILTGKLFELFGAEPDAKPLDKELLAARVARAKAKKFLGARGSPKEQSLEWVTLYKELGLTLDPSEVKIPEQKPGFNRLIMVAKGMTPQKAFDLCLKPFNGACWKFTDDSLDKAVPTNDRRAEDGPYAIWIREREEADKELKNLSADDLTEKKIKGPTLLERLLYELKYHAETGKHLDRKNWTLCSGSRDSDGHVPDVSWYDDKLRVSWFNPSSWYSDVRSREVVSL